MTPASRVPERAYRLHVPPTAAARGADAPLLVCVHGISRNAGAHLRAFRDAALAVGCVVVAPRFGRAAFPDYQRFGRPGRLGRGGRADLRLLAILDDVRARLGLRDAPVYLFGHSGGAQFAQRFAMTRPSAVARCVLSAPGCYAWPDADRAFPFGGAPSRRFPDLHPSVDALLEVPTLVLVGEHDVAADRSLRSGPRLDASQGASRRERAERYVAALRALAAGRGRPPPARLERLPGCGHAFGECVRAGRLAGRALDFLFGDAGCRG